MMPIHDRIMADAAKAQVQASRNGPISPAEFESLKNLIDSATDALHAALPASFEHHGKTYRLVTDIQRARVAIFESMVAEKSMLVTLICKPEEPSGSLQGGH